MKQRNESAVIILAAGYSKRMGFPKPFLECNQKITFLEKIITEYRSFGCNQVVVVLNKNNLEYYSSKGYNFLKDTEVVVNHHPEYERFYSIISGLKSVGDYPYCFIQNSDSPFIDFEILTNLYKNRNENIYIIPAYKNRRGHPILLSSGIVKRVLSETNYTLNFKDVISGFGKRVIEMETGSFLIDVNTGEDYQRLSTS